MQANQYLIDFYDHYNEDGRLAVQHGSVEFLTTMRYIEKYLRPGSRVLEIGAGTGRYSCLLYTSWEMNGLLAVRRRQNGYRVYTDKDLQRLKVIRSLRCANYSLEAILGLLSQLSQNPDVDIKAALNTPKADETIIAVCDRLLTSLSAAEENAKQMLCMLQGMKAANS